MTREDREERELRERRLRAQVLQRLKASRLQDIIDGENEILENTRKRKLKRKGKLIGEF